MNGIYATNAINMPCRMFVPKGGSGFLTDSDISRAEFRERELTPWRPDEDLTTSWETSLYDIIYCYVIRFRF